MVSALILGYVGYLPHPFVKLRLNKQALNSGVRAMLSQLFAYVGRVVYSGLKLLEQTVKTWTKPNTATVVISALADMTRTKGELIAENALLRQQLTVLQRYVKRPKFTASDRWLMVLLARQVRYWKQALLIVQPDTLVRWHREL